jgi:hypothetical protein
MGKRGMGYYRQLDEKLGWFNIIMQIRILRDG